MFLKREKLYHQDMQIDYIGINLEPKFNVGYGLDYDGWGRNFKNLLKQKE